LDQGTDARLSGNRIKLLEVLTHEAGRPSGEERPQSIVDILDSCLGTSLTKGCDLYRLDVFCPTCRNGENAVAVNMWR
jgi:hypothetical protein